MFKVGTVGKHFPSTEVLRQLSSMGRLVVSAGDGAVQSSTNLSLLRHGISIWVDVPLDIVASEIVEKGAQLFRTEISPSASHSEVCLNCNGYKNIQECP
ncbi:putative shikimate kinase/gluconokinase [Helianthus anomalus]